MLLTMIPLTMLRFQGEPKAQLLPVVHLIAFSSRFLGLVQLMLYIFQKYLMASQFLLSMIQLSPVQLLYLFPLLIVQ